MILTSTSLAGLLMTMISILPGGAIPAEPLLLLGLSLFAIESASNGDANDEDNYVSNDRGPYNIIKSQDTLHIMLEHANNTWYRQFFRCGCRSFEQLCDLLQLNPIFHSSGTKPQRPIKIQLAVFLRHFGSSNGHYLNIARECNIGTGSVFLYVDCVTKAFQELGRRFVVWPDINHRAEIRAAFGDQGFEGVIGAIDGSLVHLVEVPAVDGSYYYCWKKFWGLCHGLAWTGGY